MNSVLVIIVTYNAMNWAKKCFDSLRLSSVPVDVFVVDNGSQDGTQEYIKENYPETIFFQSPSNLGFGKANNIGMKYAFEKNYEYVYLLNQDAWIFPDTLQKLITVSECNCNYGILSPMQTEANGSYLDDNFVARVCTWKVNRRLVSDFYFNKLDKVYSVDFVMAAHWLITNQCLKKIGAFSPIFPHYGEDGNYANRVIYHGMKIGIVPDALGVHDRENRPTPLSKKLYIEHINCLRKLSNPFNNIWKQIITEFFHSIRSMFRYKRLIPIINFVKIVFTLNSIIKYRNISIVQISAFIK